MIGFNANSTEPLVTRSGLNFFLGFIRSTWRELGPIIDLSLQDLRMRISLIQEVLCLISDGYLIPKQKKLSVMVGVVLRVRTRRVLWSVLRHFIELSRAGKEILSNSKTRIKRLRKQLETEGIKTNPNLQIMKNWRNELADAYREEEIYWKERSKEKWLKDGDRNTRFFHGSVKHSKMQNKILSLVDEHGIEQFSEGSKGNIAVEYFQILFITLNPDIGVEVLEGMTPRVSDSVNRELTKDISDEEILLASFGIKAGSAPGADVMTDHFSNHIGMLWDSQ